MYRVGAVNKAIKNVIESNQYFQEIIVIGEISNFKPHQSGNLYFKLKDEDAVIDVVMYKWNVNNIKFTPEDGMEVIIKGQITFYDKSGRLQLVGEKMGQSGVGNLHQKFEEMKKVLHKEGLFDPKYKKPIPKFPKVIGVVTSQTGAAVRDIISTIRRRYPIAKIELYPVIVQGDKASPSIIKAIDYFCKKNTADVLIVGRGGGSIEDLWAFNEESVARAIFNATIPIISAVGHETDTTIADFVADIRAATPTGAAELATPFTVKELETKNEKATQMLKATLERKLKRNKEMKLILHKNLLYRHPQKKLGDMIQTKDRMIDDLEKVMRKKLDKHSFELSALNSQIKSLSPVNKSRELNSQLEHLKSMLNVNIQSIMKEHKSQLNEKLIQLDGLSPLKIMSKGYSLTYKDAEVIKDIHSIKQNDQVTVKMANGQYKAVVEEVLINKEEN